jgi:poly(ADP-ribose) glycohydrolase ARH3
VAQVLAAAVALASRADQFDPRAFYRELLGRVRTEEFTWHLSVAAKLRGGDSVAGLGSTLHAHRSVVTAIACFAKTPGDFESAISLAISLGDDTDTVAAMTGALVGAFDGRSAVPDQLVDQLEDGPKGRGHILALAATLFDRYSARLTA